MVKENNIQVTKETVLTFSESSWNNCIDTGRSKGGYMIWRDRKSTRLNSSHNDTFDTTERALPADEVMPVKCAFKSKLNSYGVLDKLKARICVRGDMQIKDLINNWSPTASVRLLKCFLADAAVLQVWLVDNKIIWLR